jgi:hypothetical protein
MTHEVTRGTCHPRRRGLSSEKENTRINFSREIDSIFKQMDEWISRQNGL